MSTITLHKKVLMILVTFCLAVGGNHATLRGTPVTTEGFPEEDVACPPCELLFRKLERSREGGKLSQVVRVQERGEPKSGTGMMFDWATGALMRTCNYLKHFFGERSCRVDLARWSDAFGPPLDRDVERRMVFNPALGGRDARCSCDTIERVSILISRANKHTLPVSSSCAYTHNRGIELALVQPAGHHHHRGGAACKFPDGAPVTNHADLWRCMHEADCNTTDDWLQMVVFRDPRPAVVSAYFHLGVHSDMDLGPLEEFIARELPIMCQWLALRYILFSGLLSHQSVAFWYSDAMAHPLDWHHRWLDAVGLQLPFDVVEATARAASADDFGFRHKTLDVHPGEKARAGGRGVRRFEDEVDPEVLEIADAVLRVWLPPVLLEKLGVAP